MTDKDLQNIQYRVLEMLQEQINKTLEQEPCDYGDDNPKYELEEHVWRSINELKDNLDELLKEYQTGERKFIVGQWYLDNYGNTHKCTRRSDNSVWMDNTRLNLFKCDKREFTRGTWCIEA